MNRQEFMSRLEQLLYDLPAEERTDALQYYNDYFDDAGLEREQEVIRELISPEHVARTIREGMKEQTGQSGDWSGQSQQGDYRTQGGYSYSNYNQNGNYQQGTNGNSAGNRMPVWGWVLLLVTAPITLPIIFSIFAAIFSVFMGVLGAVIGFWAGGIGLVIGAATLFATGFSGLGCVCLGIGFLLECFAFLMVPFVIWLLRSAVPQVYHFIKRQVDKLLKKGGNLA